MGVLCCAAQYTLHNLVERLTDMEAYRTPQLRPPSVTHNVDKVLLFQQIICSEKCLECKKVKCEVLIRIIKVQRVTQYCMFT